MDTFKNVVSIACIVGICDKIISIVCGEKYSSQMRLITALVMILSVGSQISGGIYIPDTSYYESELKRAENDTKEEYLKSVELSISDRLYDIYESRGITLKKISIACSYDEYKFIRVDKITLYLNGEEEKNEELRSVAEQYFPGAEITVLK